jgi:aryl-alcohol dehydrogenase-like predicted oxidoreductase
MDIRRSGSQPSARGPAETFTGTVRIDPLFQAQEPARALAVSVTFERDIATGKKATPAQVALAWLLARKPWIVPIPGTTKLARLEENLGAAAVTLTPDDIRGIESAAARIEVQGARYPEALEKRTGL